MTVKKESSRIIMESYTTTTDILIAEKRVCTCDADLSTKRGQNCQLIKIIILAVIPLMVLVIQGGITVASDSKVITLENTVKDNILCSVDVAKLVHDLQNEMEITILNFSSDGETSVYANLQQSRSKTDSSIGSLSRWITLSSPSYFQSIETFQKRLQNNRDTFDNLNITFHDIIKFYADDNDAIIEWIGTLVISIENINEASWKPLIGYHMLLVSEEQSGIERAVGSLFYTKGSILDEDLLFFKEKITLQESHLQRSMQYSTTVKQQVNSRYTSSDLATHIQNMRSDISSNNSAAASGMAGVYWFDNTTELIIILEDIQNILAKEIIDLLEEHINELTEEMVINIIEMVAAIIMFPLTVFFVHRLLKKLHIFANSLRYKTYDLEKERKRSEQLLYQMLPISIAKRMMKKMAVIPEYYESVTIYFSDLVGFTTICSQSTPMQVMYMLNLLYVMIDEALESFDVYKVETIGDAYMVVSGLPVRNKDKHAVEISLMSLDVMKQVGEATVPHIPHEHWKLRIGVNTGSVVAGVVGTKMPRYCLFGDTVNVASRMESTGKPCMIQISVSTKEALDSTPEFLIRERGAMTIKGKGLMKTYWLLGHSNGYRCPTPNLFLTES